MSSSHAGDIALAGGSVGAGIAAVWAGIKWLAAFVAGRLDKREAELNAREARLDAEEGERMEELRTEIRDLNSWRDEARREIEALRISVHLLLLKVARDDPNAPELRQVSDLLGSAFPIHVQTPSDMTAALNAIGDET